MVTIPISNGISKKCTVYLIFNYLMIISDDYHLFVTIVSIVDVGGMYCHQTSTLFTM